MFIKTYGQLQLASSSFVKEKGMCHDIYAVAVVKGEVVAGMLTMQNFTCLVIIFKERWLDFWPGLGRRQRSFNLKQQGLKMLADVSSHPKGL